MWKFQWPLRGLGQCNGGMFLILDQTGAYWFQWPLRGLGQCNISIMPGTGTAFRTVSMASARPRAMQRPGGKGRKAGTSFQWPLRGLGQCN